MPFPAIPLAITGLSALAGLFGGRKQTPEQSSTSNSSSTSNNTYDNLTSPELSDTQQLLSRLFTSGLINRFTNGNLNLDGYTAGGLQEINRGADLKSKAIANILASRGLSYSPTAGFQQGNVESQRIGDNVNFLNQIPLLQRQFQNEDISGLIQGFGALPTAQRNSGTYNTTQNSTTSGRGTQLVPGNMAAGGISGLGQGLALFPQLLNFFNKGGNV